MRSRVELIGGKRTAAALFSLLIAVGAVEVLVLGGCTDGKTPDCSDAAAGCSPDLDGSGPIGEGGSGDARDDALPDGSPRDASSDSPLNSTDAADTGIRDAAGDADAGK